jgi:two-component system cell cycle response regulator
MVILRKRADYNEQTTAIRIKNTGGITIMGHTTAVDKIVEHLEGLNQMYDTYRIIDPLHKRVLKLENDGLHITDLFCYDLWLRDKMCDNCTSIRAFNEKETFVKIDSTHNQIFMMTSIPILIEQDIFIVELLKDVTKSMFYHDGDTGKMHEIYKMINDLNLAILKDGLTEIYNKRFINEKLPIDIIESVTKTKNLSIILADIDHFKEINDTYGHVAGDYILKSIAETLKDCVRDSDWIARYGGEEFLICLSNTSIETATSIAERMRRTIEEKNINYEGQCIHTTMSFGVYTLNKQDNCSLESFITCADKKLYAAKNSGRNCVIS